MAEFIIFVLIANLSLHKMIALLQNQEMAVIQLAAIGLSLLFLAVFLTCVQNLDLKISLNINK